MDKKRPLIINTHRLQIIQQAFLSIQIPTTFSVFIITLLSCYILNDLSKNVKRKYRENKTGNKSYKKIKNIACFYVEIA